jgi:putative FmdB family regulatory protein
MPIYEYECQACGHQFEYLLLPSSPAAKCASCGSKKLEKMISKCAVSSENTRESNLSSARKQAQKIGKEKQHEEHKQMHHHHD